MKIATFTYHNSSAESIIALIQQSELPVSAFTHGPSSRVFEKAGISHTSLGYTDSKISVQTIGNILDSVKPIFIID